MKTLREYFLSNDKYHMKIGKLRKGYISYLKDIDTDESKEEAKRNLDIRYFMQQLTEFKQTGCDCSIDSKVIYKEVVSSG